MSSHIRPIVLLRQRDIAHYLNLACAAVREWEGKWLTSTVLDVTCNAATPRLESCVWSAYKKHGDGALAWCYRTIEFDRKVENCIFDLNDSVRSTDRHRPSSIANGVTENAISELIGGLIALVIGEATQLQGSDSAPESWLFSQYSGSIMIEVFLSGSALSILVPFSNLDSLDNAKKYRGKKALTPLPIAIANTQLRLTAELGQVAMSIGNFASLQIGDVINLGIGLDQTTIVLTENRTPVGAGYLGQQDGVRALNIFKLPSSNNYDNI